MARTSKIGGIDINEKTPLSTILRALWYEYADGFHLAKSGSRAENLKKAVFEFVYLNSGLAVNLPTKTTLFIFHLY